MSQTIALNVRTPQVSLADVVQQVQRNEMDALRLQEMQREAPLHAQQTQQKLDYGNALDRYRSGMAEGDPAAIKQLDAYPEEQKKLYDAFDGMSPEQYRKASETAQAFANAARRVASFGEGTPEQAQAWQVEIDKLFQGGFIDQQYADLYKKQGPNMALVNEALQLGKFAESYTGKNAVNRARQEEVLGRIRNNEMKTNAQIEQGNRRVDAQIAQQAKKSGKGGDTSASGGMSESEQGRRLRSVENALSKYREKFSDPQDVANEEARLRRSFGLDAPNTTSAFKSEEPGIAPGAPSPAPVKAEDEAGDKPDGSRERPFTPNSAEDFDQVPKGALYLNPTDNTLYRKN